MAIEGKGDGAALRRLRLGMVGGGEGAFIGAVHRIAARLDDRYELVAGALSSEPERARASAAKLRIAPERAYGSFHEMAAQEAARDDGIDVVAIVTPNHLHHPVAKAFLEAGIHVICDKPMTTTVEDALDLVQTVRRTGLVFGLTHNYTGHPMVREARARVQAGELGAIRVVQVEYPQDWLTTKLEDTGQKQAAWRTDPAQLGRGRRDRRHRLACLQPRGLHHRARGRVAVRRPCHLRRRPPGRRQLQPAAALRRRRPRHALGLPGGARQRERAADPRLRRAGRARVAPGAARSAAAVSVRQAAAG